MFVGGIGVVLGRSWLFKSVSTKWKTSVFTNSVFLTILFSLVITLPIKIIVLITGTFLPLVDARLATIAVSLLLILVMLRCPVILRYDKDSNYPKLLLCNSLLLLFTDLLNA